MALSNLRNEPRREITEQVLGFATFGLLIWGNYKLAQYGSASDPLILRMLVVALAMFTAPFLLIMLAFAIHALGEFVCNRMAALGFDPRPKRRY